MCGHLAAQRSHAPPTVSSALSPPTNLTVNQSTPSRTQGTSETPKQMSRVVSRRIELSETPQNEVAIDPTPDELDD